MSSIYVFAGTNGAGKSSVISAIAVDRELDYYNPDEAARAIMAEHPGMPRNEADSEAWKQGRLGLEHAIDTRTVFAFETTLGGSTIPRLLAKAADQGCAVRVAYVGLTSPELHIARVKTRVSRGGHDIPEAVIRDRYDRGREHLIHLLPKLTELWLFDNSFEADPEAGQAPAPELLLHLHNGKRATVTDLTRTPSWAKKIVMTGLEVELLEKP